MGKNKPARNAFYYFVQDYKAKQPKQFDTIEEFYTAAGPYWSQLSAEERRPYEERAKRDKNSQKVVKYTTSGIDISVVERREQEKEAKKQKSKEDIETIINMAVNTGRIADESFYIVHVNFFCQYTDSLKYVPAELAIARFTLRDGVVNENVFHTRVEPGMLQIGYSSIAKDISENSHKIPPPTSYQKENNNMATVYAGLKAFMRDQHPTGQLPPIYAETKNMHIVENVLNTLIYEYGGLHESFKLRVFPLDYFFYTLRNAVGSMHSGKQVWPQLSASILQLEKDEYDFCLDVACQFHQISDAPNHCSKSHVMRNAYLICDNCCGDLEIDLIPGKHVPRKANVALSRPPSRATSTVSSYATARSLSKQSMIREDDYYSSSAAGSVFSETSTLVDPDEFCGRATPSVSNESALTDDEEWEKPKQRHHKKVYPSSQESVQSNSQSQSNRSRRPVYLSAALGGISLADRASSDIRSTGGRGRGRGFSDRN